MREAHLIFLPFFSVACCLLYYYCLLSFAFLSSSDSHFQAKILKEPNIQWNVLLFPIPTKKIKRMNSSIIVLGLSGFFLKLLTPFSQETYKNSLVSSLKKVYTHKLQFFNSMGSLPRNFRWFGTKKSTYKSGPPS